VRTAAADARHAAHAADASSGCSVDVSMPAEEATEGQEETAKVELKGDGKTDIVFASKASFRLMNDGKWGEPTVGALSIRRDKASGTSWLQMNSEAKV
jgi:hypothetical protein